MGLKMLFNGKDLSGMMKSDLKGLDLNAKMALKEEVREAKKDLDQMDKRLKGQLD